MMATFLGLHFFFGVKPHIWMDTGILLMFYALYYGVVARDVAEYCTEKMVVQIGVSTGLLNKFRLHSEIFASEASYFYKKNIRLQNIAF